MSGDAVVVDGVSKRFRLYAERNNTLKSTIMRGRKARFEEFWAVKDVSFEVPKGSTFGLIGRNGSGKSTLLKMLARILYPDGGNITMNGRTASLLEVGSGFHPELSGRENIYLNGAILGMQRKEIEHRFDDIVDFSGVRKFIDQPVKNFSSGMYVRLGFSVAIHMRPEILIVDEILSVGDAEFRAKSAAKFQELMATGCTIVLVSHSMNQVRALCDHVAWIDGGSLKQIGTSKTVVDAYEKAVTA